MDRRSDVQAVTRRRGRPIPVAEALAFMDRFSSENGYPPSYREMMFALGYGSTASVKRAVDAMEACGLVRRGGVARSTVVTELGRRLIGADDGTAAGAQR